MGLRLLFLPNFPGATFIQGGTFIPDSRVVRFIAETVFSYLLKFYLKNIFMAESSKSSVSKLETQ